MIGVLFAPLRFAVWLIMLPISLTLTCLATAAAVTPWALVSIFSFSLGYYWNDASPYVETGRQLLEAGLGVSAMSFGFLNSICMMLITAVSS